MDGDSIDSNNGMLASQFFRNPEIFQALREVVLPALLAQAEHTGRSLRLWSVGCSTGEDTYSLAMLIAGLLGDSLPSWTIRIFATDSDEAALNFVKQGIYIQDSLHNLSEEESKRWFDATNQNYRIHKVLRKMVIIGQHNIAQDIPFARMDLIMCGDALFSCSHERLHDLVRMFALSLAHTHGYLAFGRSENITLSPLNFQRITEAAPIYQNITDTFSRKAASNNSPTSILKKVLQHKDLIPSRSVITPPPVSLQEVLFRLAPTGIVIIDQTYRIVTANRAAQRLCSLPEEAHLQDFLHVVPGLPYTSVRTAIDMTFCEGSIQNIPEVELTLTKGGNGRVLDMHICLLPGEVATPDYVVIYIQEVTEQVIIKQANHTIRETFQNLQISYTTLTQQHKLLTENHEQLQKTSTEIISLYEQLLVKFEECEAAKETLEQDQAALQEELETVCDALSLNQISS